MAKKIEEPNKLSKEERRMLFEQKVREEEAAMMAAAKAKAEAEAAANEALKQTLEMRWVYDPIKNQWMQCYVSDKNPLPVVPPIQNQTPESLHSTFLSPIQKPIAPTPTYNQSIKYHLDNLNLTDTHLNDLKLAVNRFNAVTYNLTSPSPASPNEPKPKPVFTTQQIPRKNPLVSVSAKLPPNWKCKRNKSGRIYYYNIKTKRTQWTFPKLKAKPKPNEAKNVDKVSSTTNVNYPKLEPTISSTVCDASSSTTSNNNDFKVFKEKFREKLSKFIVKLLEPYLKPDCKYGYIQNVDDFKHLARKFTHIIIEKEMSRTTIMEELELSKRVKVKTQEYISKYMSVFANGYSRKADDTKSMSQDKNS